MKKTEIINFYTDFLLEEGRAPINVYKFCKLIEIEESEFYKHFASFESVEKEVFVHFYHETIRVLEESEDFNSFEPKDKLLSFYYTYIENLTANRSLIIYLLKDKNPIIGLQRLSSLKKLFIQFVVDLNISTNQLPISSISDIQSKGIQETIWGQFLTIIKYWMNDESSSFEKTDVFIEKSTSLGFELLNNSHLESIIDFGKFILKDKLKI
jgi:hypothetical protein